MRTLLPIVCAAAIAAATVWTFGTTADAEQGFKLRIADSNGKAAGNLPVSINGTSLGSTDSLGELELALDPAKNGRTFNVYRKDCTQIVIYEAGSEEDLKCEKESQVEAGQTIVRKTAPPKGTQRECDGCRRYGAFIFGRDATVGEFSSGRTARNLTIGGLAGGAAIAGALIARNGGGSNGTAAPQQPFAGISNTYQLNNLTGNGGCPGFTPTAIATMILFIDAITGLGNASVQYSGSRTEYSSARATKDSNQNVITGTGANVFTPTRNFVAEMRAVILDGRLISFRETFLQTTGAGSPCTQMYAQ
jgi:hypothetical protein